MQFSVNGLPVDGSVHEVPQDVVTIDIYVTPDGDFDAFWVEILPMGPWVPPEPLPKVGSPDDWAALVDSGDVRMLDVWDNEWAIAYWDDPYGVWAIGGYLPEGYERTPQAVAEFDVDLSSYPVSTVLNLEFDWAEVSGREPDVTYPLVLHVTPEPATLGLLALGAAAMIRRRR
ncbi:MAG TPA: PEP-CTERM sorting domain-containing protein [Phycisphaerae bacterium]|nr:PEP-CTERM sorting domain-containing protein [Phycisphaerae bacterium]